MLSRFFSLKHSALPFSDRVLHRFFFGACDILLSVLLLFSDLRCVTPYLPLSKLFDRMIEPFAKRFRLLVAFTGGGGGISGESLDDSLVKRVLTIGKSFLLFDVWSSMPLTFIVILVENEDEAVVLIIC